MFKLILVIAVTVIATTCAPVPGPAPAPAGGPLSPFPAPYPLVYAPPYVKGVYPYQPALLPLPYYNYGYKWIHPGPFYAY